MLTDKYRTKVIQEYAEAAVLFADIINEEGCNSTTFILFKLLTDITVHLKQIDAKLDRIDKGIRARRS